VRKITKEKDVCLKTSSAICFNRNMRLLVQRYISANFIIPFLVSTIFFVSFLLTFQLFRVTRLVINKGVSWTMVMELMGHISISFLPMGIPLSVLFAAIFTYNKMSSDSEIMAMRSVGLPKFKIYMPVLIPGVFIAIATFAINQSIIPYSKGEFKKAVTILTSKGLLADIKKGNFFTDIPDVILFAEGVTDKGKSLENVFIHIKGKNDSEKIIQAKKGLIHKKNDTKWGGSSLKITLKEGNIIQYYTEGAKVEKILFKTYDFPLVQEDLVANVATRDSMRTSSQLYKIIKGGRRTSPLPNWDTDYRKEFIKTKLEFFGRINTPFLVLVFTLIGFGLGVQRSRGQKQNTGFYCLVILGSYYSLFFVGLTMARKEQLMPSVAVFTPTMIALVVGIYFYKRLDWIG